MRIFMLIPALAVLISTNSQAQQETNQGPQLTFETKTLDLGLLTPEAPTVFRFNFSNTGDEDLIINQVKTSCGCLVPRWDREPIPPGESSVIQARYNSKGRIGPFQKSITITSNATPSVEVLQVKGEVRPFRYGLPVEGTPTPSE